MKIKLKPCPFCGFQPDPDDDDCIYRGAPPFNFYELNCYETGGGCSANVLGKSIEDVVTRWNTRDYEESTPF